MVAPVYHPYTQILPPTSLVFKDFDENVNESLLSDIGPHFGVTFQVNATRILWASSQLCGLIPIQFDALGRLCHPHKKIAGSLVLCKEALAVACQCLSPPPSPLRPNHTDDITTAYCSMSMLRHLSGEAGPSRWRCCAELATHSHTLRNETNQIGFSPRLVLALSSATFPAASLSSFSSEEPSCAAAHFISTKTSTT